MFHTKIFALLAQYAQFRSPKQKKNQLRFEQQNLKKVVKMKKASLEKTKKILNQAKLSKSPAIKISCLQSTCTQPRKPGLEDH